MDTCVRGSRFFLGGGIANSDKMPGLYTDPRTVLPVYKEQVSTGVPFTGTNRSIGVFKLTGIIDSSLENNA